MKRELLLLLVYVDDILIFYRNENDLNFIRKDLLQELDMKDLETAYYCLGIEITRRIDYIAISQSSYISIKLHLNQATSEKSYVSG